MSRAGSAAATVFSYALHTRLISFALKTAAPVSGALTLRSKRFALSALEFYAAAWLRQLVSDRVSRGGSKSRAFSEKMRKSVMSRAARPVFLTARGRFESREAASNRTRKPLPQAVEISGNRFCSLPQSSLEIRTIARVPSSSCSWLSTWLNSCSHASAAPAV